MCNSSVSVSLVVQTLDECIEELLMFCVGVSLVGQITLRKRSPKSIDSVGFMVPNRRSKMG